MAACSAALATQVGSTALEALQGFASATAPTEVGFATAQTEAGSAAQTAAGSAAQDAGSTAPVAGRPAPKTATSCRISLGALDAGVTVEEPEVEVTLLRRLVQVRGPWLLRGDHGRQT